MTDSCLQVTKAAGQVGIPGLYVTEDPGAETEVRHFPSQCPPF